MAGVEVLKSIKQIDESISVSWRPELVPDEPRLAESYLTSTLFRQILGRIQRLAWHPT